ncbi:cation diffusion facilitator family transporter [Cutibacterium avidum]|uniref:CDF family cation diffusion facilitator n=1 Tax=Cutibacterium avidum ATCC 25577 TaxID=997355 RepID=G4CVM1_9ACTN|nr:cation diffusion facilitator family transporter [Cutibacterium avidum]EGY78627.1 CDF family cation diffusion facilitator [Cutibacterium avidum ATCC 25577]QRH09734.1 cation transporter [Cutibacterium avidum]
MTTIPDISEAPPRHRPPDDLSRFAWLSIAAAAVTILLKTLAWRITGSVGLLSDAAESLVNLVAAIIALVALKVSIRPPDKNHPFGHSKAEYFSAGAEGMMIFIAAAVIMYTAVQRFIHPRSIEDVGIGLLVSVLASVVNGLVAWVLLKNGRQRRSMTLIADGKHMLTDVWTSVGVLVGVGLVWLTGWQRLDPIVAFAVGVNILVTGAKLVGQSGTALLDVSLPKEDNEAIRDFLDAHSNDHVKFHAVRTREAGYRRFLEFHMLVPGSWTVKQGHDAMEDLIDEILDEWPEMRVSGHLEPIEDPRSYEDMDV